MDAMILRRQCYDTEKTTRRLNILLAIVLVSLIGYNLYNYVNAATSLQSTMKSSAFRGAVETLEKATWLWAFMQYIITWTCGISLVITTVNFFLILSYKAGQNIFMLVDEIKSERMDGEGFGYKELVKNVWSAKAGGSKFGTGIFDTILVMLLSLVPNLAKIVKGLNQTGGEGSKNTELVCDSDSMLQTTFKAFKLFFVTTCILCLGFNGTAVEALVLGIDAIDTIGGHFVQYEATTFVERKLSGIGGYNVQIGKALNNESGKLAETVFKEIYNGILSRVDVAYTKDAVQAIGAATEKIVYEELLGSSTTGYDRLTELANSTSEGEDDYVFREVNASNIRDVKVDVRFSHEPETVGNVGISIDMQDIMDRAGASVALPAQRYAHVFVNFARNTSSNASITDGSNKAKEVDSFDIGNQVEKVE